MTTFEKEVTDMDLFIAEILRHNEHIGIQVVDLGAVVTDLNRIVTWCVLVLIVLTRTTALPRGGQLLIGHLLAHPFFPFFFPFPSAPTYFSYNSNRYATRCASLVKGALVWHWVARVYFGMVRQPRYIQAVKPPHPLRRNGCRCGTGANG
jgi:hypothetical protein